MATILQRQVRHSGAELMAALGRHLSGMRTRASGCTCLVDGTVNGTDR